MFWVNRIDDEFWYAWTESDAWRALTCGDGNQYIDYVGLWGPAIIGHADDEVLAALAETMKGTSFGAPRLLENVLAEMVISAVPSIEMVRFVNSGTEACMDVLRLTRSGVATLGLPDSPGVRKAATFETLTAPYNDIEAVESRFNSNKGELAAIILEPVVGNSVFIPPKPDFLEVLRRLIKENGALLIFDEVMTGFRLSYGGAQEYFGITRFNNTREDSWWWSACWCIWREEGDHGNGILDTGKTTGHAICGGHISGMFGFFFTEGPVHNFDDAKKSDTAKFARFYRGMLEEGVYSAPSQFEAGFTSLAHSSEDIRKTIAAAEKVLSKI
ncbi:Glutamate-1-semialdehyde 2,1-aminomutase [Hibiscus syriacus]|uniref:Glutamate-1-semialdehyde 2,1-aminomutase n=1 Tax=Hibiscus syriacus TaxID=106335 RepID=A0A6A2YIR2_HIBSY|nr:Glutamate-1-semialdehyde 2,1-aminomutase [Hibiscus syriacus]